LVFPLYRPITQEREKRREKKKEDQEGGGLGFALIFIAERQREIYLCIYGSCGS